MEYKIRRDPRPRPQLPVPAAQEGAEAEAVAAIVEDFVLQLDNPAMCEFQNAFLDEGEDGNFWDEDNIAPFLGDLELEDPDKLLV